MTVARRTSANAWPLAAFFVLVQFYTSLAALAPTPPVGYVFANRTAAAVLIGVVAGAALWCAAALVRARSAVPAPSATLLGAWIGSAALATAFGFDPLSGAQVVAMMLLAAVFHVALVRYYDQPRVAETVLGLYLLAGLAANLAGLAMLVLRRPAALWSLNHGRAAGLFVTANQYADFLIALLFVAGGVALGGPDGLRRLGGAVAATASIALVATVSVAGWAGAVAGASFYAFALGRRRLAAGGLLGAAALAAALVAIRPAAAHNPADVFDRLRTWRSGLRVVELFPLTGVGPMAYWRVYPEVRPPNGDAPGTFGALHPHNAYLSLAGETGLAGLAAAGVGWWAFVRSMRRRLAAAAPGRRRVALGVCAALVAILVQGVFDTIGIVQMTFVWIPYTALALAAAGAAERS